MARALAFANATIVFLSPLHLLFSCFEFQWVAKRLGWQLYISYVLIDYYNLSRTKWFTIYEVRSRLFSLSTTHLYFARIFLCDVLFDDLRRPPISIRRYYRLFALLTQCCSCARAPINQSQPNYVNKIIPNARVCTSRQVFSKYIYKYLW